MLDDIPADVRDARLEAQVQEIGGFRADQDPFPDRVVAAATEAELRWRIVGNRGDLLVDMRLVGLPEPRVQGLGAAVVAPGQTRVEGEGVGAAERHRIILPSP